MMTRRPAVLAASMLLLSGCSSGIEQGASDTGSLMQPAESVSPSATPVSGCPSGSATDQPGPPDQARPNLSVMGVLAAMDTTAGRIVAWAYDLAENTWTQVDAEGGGSDSWPIVAYDPDRQQILAWEHHGLHGAMVKALDLESGTWQVLYAQDQASGAAPPGADALIMGQAVAAYDTAVHRLILILTNAGDLEQTGETWAFDPVEGTWEHGAPVPNTLPGGYPAGWAAAFDPQQGRTVLFADTAVLAYDAAADTWTTVDRGPGWPTGCTAGGVAVDPTARVGHEMVYDPTTGRMIVLGGSVRPVGEPPGGLSDEEAPAVDDVWAYDLASNTWTQLLAPSATDP